MQSARRTEIPRFRRFRHGPADRRHGSVPKHHAGRPSRPPERVRGSQNPDAAFGPEPTFCASPRARVKRVRFSGRIINSSFFILKDSFFRFTFRFAFVLIRFCIRFYLFLFVFQNSVLFLMLRNYSHLYARLILHSFLIRLIFVFYLFLFHIRFVF